jgi:hypothetical protein
MMGKSQIIHTDGEDLVVTTLGFLTKLRRPGYSGN